MASTRFAPARGLPGAQFAANDDGQADQSHAEECIALLPADSPATIDEDFASDVAAAVAAHREPLNPPAWD